MCNITSELWGQRSLLTCMDESLGTWYKNIRVNILFFIYLITKRSLCRFMSHCAVSRRNCEIHQSEPPLGLWDGGRGRREKRGHEEEKLVGEDPKPQHNYTLKIEYLLPNWSRPHNEGCQSRPKENNCIYHHWYAVHVHVAIPTHIFHSAHITK